MTVEQLEEGVMRLWQDCWNAAAFTRRKRHYRDLLRARPRSPAYPARIEDASAEPPVGLTA
jgi:hypothetical protein